MHTRWHALTVALARLERRILALLAVVALVLGVIGFGLQRGYTLTFVDRLYYAVQLFAFEYNVRPADNVPLNVARFLAPAVALWAAALALSSAFRDEVHNIRARLQRNHVVVAGLGAVGQVVAEGFRDERRRVVAIELDSSETALRNARDKGYITIQGDAREAVTLETARIEKASHFIVVCGSDERNAEAVAAARRLVGPRRRDPLRCVVQIADYNLGKLLSESALAIHSDEPMRVEFFSLAERGARAMVTRYPPFDPRTGQADGRQPRLLVVGLGDMGGAAIALAALRWRLLDRPARLPITVLDRRAGENVAELVRAYRGIADVCDFDPLDVDLRDPTFERGELLAGEQFTTAYVFLSDDAAALTAALAVRRLRVADPVVVRTTRHPNLAALLERAEPEGGLPALYAFNVIDEVCKPAVLLEGSSESIARAIHARHVRSQRDRGLEDSPSLRPWDELEEHYRESSRQSAEHIAKKLAAVGCTVVRFTDWSQEAVTFRDEEIERMAELEHERWNAERRKSQPDHPSIVDWADLEEPNREYDRAIVREIPEMLANVGYAVVREPVEVHA